MASSIASDSYYLSSKNSLNSNKEYIFVKLTDSALKCLEEFLNNQNKHGSSCPSIKFMGNQGFLSFPTSGTNNNQNQPVEQKFSFSISDIEGPKGSFECIQQSHGQMNVLGALQYKMTVQAKEDVFAHTKNQMATQVEIQKTKRTREIKPNLSDIGRKIVSKRPLTQNYNSRTTSQQSGTPNNQLSSLKNNRLPSSGGLQSGSINNTPLSQSSSSQQLTSLSNIASASSSLLLGNENNNKSNTSYNNNSSSKNDDDERGSGIGGSGGSGGGGFLTFNSTSSYHNNNNHHDSHTPLNSQYASSPIPASNLLNQRYNSHHHSNEDLLHHNNSNGNNNRGGQVHHRNPDIMKRSIKERLIHLLALRPFKKPELLTRINSEGIRERDRNLISNVLKSISTARDNVYLLNRYVWNDVQEDWPFYTESERQILKRRKPQNLTPPLSSDGGSSASGQSPGSTHNGSPPPAVKRPSSTMNSMNNSVDKYMEPKGKKQRISRVKNPDHHSSITSMRPSYDHRNDYLPRTREDDYYSLNAHESEDSGLSFRVLSSDVVKRMSASVSTPPARDWAGSGHQHQQQHSAAILKIGNDGSSNRKMVNNGLMASSNNSNKLNNINTIINSNNYDTNAQSGVGGSSSLSASSSLSSSLVSTQQTSTPQSIGNNNNSNLLNSNCSPKQQQKLQQQQQQLQNGTTIAPPILPASETTAIASISLSPSSNTVTTSSTVESTATNNTKTTTVSTAAAAASRSLFLDYPPITTIEQRRKYKTEFDNDFPEYRQLHKIIENVSKRFAQLEEKLRNEEHDEDKVNEIRRQIIKEYKEKNDKSSYAEKKRRYNHLHEKLKHIKTLVSEYDKTITNGSSVTPATAPCGQINY